MSRHLDLATVPLDEAVEAVVATLDGGGLVLAPTDTVHGLVAAADDAAAVAAVFAAKRRPAERRLAVLVADTAAAGVLVTLGDVGRRLADAFWPGPLTLVGRRTPAAAAIVVGDEHTLGVRCPADELLRRVARRRGPLAATSANLSGRATPSTAAAAAAALAVEPELVVHGDPRGDVPSTVVDVTGGVHIVREGAIPAADIADVAGV